MVALFVGRDLANAPGGLAWITVIDRARPAVRPAVSVVRTVKLLVPAVVGVPLMRPVDDSVRPAGTDPAVTAQVKVPVPPDAVSVEL